MATEIERGSGRERERDTLTATADTDKERHTQMRMVNGHMRKPNNRLIDVYICYICV